MKTQEKNVCGNCRYFKDDNSGGGECHANPPVIVEAMIDEGHDFPHNAIMLASWWPNVGCDDIACRFFEESEAATAARIRAHFAALDARGAP